MSAGAFGDWQTTGTETWTDTYSGTNTYPISGDIQIQLSPDNTAYIYGVPNPAIGTVEDSTGTWIGSDPTNTTVTVKTDHINIGGQPTTDQWVINISGGGTTISGTDTYDIYYPPGHYHSVETFTGTGSESLSGSPTGPSEKQSFEQNWLNLVNQDPTLSAGAKQYVVSALQQTFSASASDPATTPAEDALVAYQNLSNLRQAGNTDLELRNAQYYLGGYKLVLYNNIPPTIAQYLPAAYDAFKGFLQSIGSDSFIRNSSNNPTSSPGGAAYGLAGVNDAAGLENSLVSQGFTNQSPLGASNEAPQPPPVPSTLPASAELATPP